MSHQLGAANFLKRYITFPDITPFTVAAFAAEKITIPNPSTFVEKLHLLKDDPSNIDFISDFDYTLTKFRHFNKQCDSLFGMWTSSPALP